MKSDKSKWRLAAVFITLFGALGCGTGVDESKFSPTPGSAPPDAPKTPAEFDARNPTSKL